MSYIAVVDIASGRIRYGGKSYSSAATNLYSGGVYGTGHTRLEAEAVARAKAEGFRQRGYTYRSLAEVKR